MEFTEKQIQDWHAYEKVRKRGQWNMFDARARIATGLTHEDYMFVLINYTGLRYTAQNKKSKPSH